MLVLVIQMVTGWFYGYDYKHIVVNEAFASSFVTIIMREFPYVEWLS